MMKFLTAKIREQIYYMLPIGDYYLKKRKYASNELEA